MTSELRDFPAFHRNIEPLTEKLHAIIPDSAEWALEIGSGSGQHVARFAKEFPDLRFQPTEADPENLPSISGWSTEAGVKNVEAPVLLDVTQSPWPLPQHQQYDLLYCFNVIHITPWEVTEHLFQGANQRLRETSRIYLYGPFRIDGNHTSESNAKFEEWLLEKSPEFGVRDVADVTSVADSCGFELAKMHEMPANNFLVEFGRP